MSVGPMAMEALMTSLSEGAVVVREFVIALCSLALGWFLLASASLRLKNWSDPRRTYGFASVTARFFVGAAFINAADYLNMQVMTWTGDAMPASNAMSVMPSAGSAIPDMILQTTMMWIATLGVMAIIKGTRLVVKAADGSGGTATQEDPGWTAAVYIVSGSMGVNLWRFVGDYI